MKVTIFTSDLGQGGVAQAAKSYLDLFQQIKQIEKIDLIVLRGNKDDLHPDGKLEKITYLNKDGTTSSIFTKLLQMMKGIIRFVLYITNSNTDVVVSLNLEPNLIVNFSKYLLNSKFKNITTEHTNLLNYYSKTNLLKSLFQSILRIIYQKSDYVLGCSEGVRQSVEKVYSIKNTAVIYNLIRSDLHYDYQKKNDYYLSLGRLDSFKGFSELIRSIGDHLILKNRQLKIAGDGPDHKKLIELTHHLKLQDHVVFLGYVKNPSLLYSEAMAYISTSYLEGFPLNIIEAQSYGLPIIASDCLSGPREILLNRSDYENRLATGHIENNGCYLIPTPDSESFHKDLNEVLVLLDSKKGLVNRMNPAFSRDQIQSKWQELLALLK